MSNRWLVSYLFQRKKLFVFTIIFSSIYTLAYTFIPFVTEEIYSILNPQEKGRNKLNKTKFVIINTMAGALRGSIVITIAYLFKIQLV